MKAQASLEFVTTYSWAIAVVLIMIGAVVYMGVFDTEVFLRPFCEVSKELVCEDYSVETNQIKLKLRNNFERNIEIYNMTIFTGVDQNIKTCNFGPPTVIDIGKTGDFTCAWGSGVLGKGVKERVGLQITYSREGGTNTYTVTGSVLAEAI